MKLEEFLEEINKKNHKRLQEWSSSFRAIRLKEGLQMYEIVDCSYHFDNGHSETSESVSYLVCRDLLYPFLEAFQDKPLIELYLPAIRVRCSESDDDLDFSIDYVCHAHLESGNLNGELARNDFELDFSRLSFQPDGRSQKIRVVSDKKDYRKLIRRKMKNAIRKLPLKQ